MQLHNHFAVERLRPRTCQTSFVPFIFTVNIWTHLKTVNFSAMHSFSKNLGFSVGFGYRNNARVQWRYVIAGVGARSFLQ